MQIAKTFKDQQVLKDISWDVKRGERVGLVGKGCQKLDLSAIPEIAFLIKVPLP